MLPEFEKLTDEQVVEEALKNRQVFGELIARYEAKLTRYIGRLGVRTYDDQVDVLQEIFIKAYKNLNSFDGSFKFSSWLYRIAHNEAISWYRKQKVRPEGNLVAEGDEVLKLIQNKDPGAEVEFDHVVNQDELTRALSSIDQKYQEALVLRYFENKEYDEISDILKVPLGSVGTLIFRGKKQLKTALNQNRLRI
jgi:RNA polymerase sigma-70 factor (ECF subfamily)